MKKIKIKVKNFGLALNPAKKGGKVGVLLRGTTSTENGELHLKYLDTIPKEIISHKDINISPEKIESLVAIISPEGNAEVYVNEVKQKAQVITKALKVKKDQMVYKDDISGICKIYFDGITFPKDHSYFCILSFGWDKIYIFDYFPTFPNSTKKIDYDVEKYIGSIYSYHLFKEYHQITNQEWDILFKQSWFPFYALKANTIDKMIKTIRSNWQIDDLIDIIEKETIDFLDSRINTWGKKKEFIPVLDFIRLGIKHHKNKDYISSSMIIYPKIESLIRKDFIISNPDKHGQNQKLLTSHINQKLKKHYDSLTIYLPERFQIFLDEIYFKNFIPNTLENEVSRHSIAHGASSSDKFTRKSSLLGLLIFSQITQVILLSE